MSSDRSSIYSSGVQQKFYDEQEDSWYKVLLAKDINSEYEGIEIVYRKYHI